MGLSTDKDREDPKEYQQEETNEDQEMPEIKNKSKRIEKMGRNR